MKIDKLGTGTSITFELGEFELFKQFLKDTLPQICLSSGIRYEWISFIWNLYGEIFKINSSQQKT